LEVAVVSDRRDDRNIRFFGKEGQDKLSKQHVTVIGVGGIGTHVVQQLALLGVGRMSLVDPEQLDYSNFNRYVGAYYDDPVPGTFKVDIGKRIIMQINPRIQVSGIRKSLVSQDAFCSIIDCDTVFGCVDKEGLRLILNELCAAYSKPYFDLSSEIITESPPRYGGRVCVSWDGQGCLVCQGQLDVREAQLDLMDPEAARDRQTIYGLPREALAVAGPSVVSLNGVIASLGVTEFMLAVTGVRPRPRGLLTYRAHSGGVTVGTDEPAPDCYYCKGIRGKGAEADVQRYLAGAKSRRAKNVQRK
jgi:hypothetical protein